MTKMVVDNICNYYYKKAVDCAQNDDISGALDFLKNIPDSYSFYNEVNKLAALCLFRLGYYSACLKRSVNIPEYEETFKQSFKSYEEYIKILIEKLENKEYKLALKVLLKYSNASVVEYNLLGCMYVLCNDIKKAQLSFYKALELDVYNDKTIHLILSLKEKNEPNSFLGLIRNLFSK